MVLHIEIGQASSPVKTNPRKWMLLGSAATLSIAFAMGLLMRKEVQAEPSELVREQGSGVVGSVRGVPHSEQRSSARYPPPSLPADFPQEALGWDRPPAESSRAIAERVNIVIDDSFGSEFPQAKRTFALMATNRWNDTQFRLQRDYYRGELSKDEMETGLHRNMLSYTNELRNQLTADEYLKFTGFPPETDPWIGFGIDQAKRGPTPSSN